ncbi:VanZ family protein [Microbacterium sp.]|uniref:VanZ family protein n=1 Tax=Microbacterium sp. TaxID=51671 RepID=UPI00281215CB|nr:VanZ family protein [Microbacterium sp.]
MVNVVQIAGKVKATVPMWRRTSTWVAVYSIVLALIAFWPQPVDAGAGRFLRWLFDTVPLLTYERLEFGSNIVLFAPFGIGLALLMRELRYLIMPLALLSSLTIESVQAVLIAERTPSVLDIVANVSGACFGLVVVVSAEALRARTR